MPNHQHAPSPSTGAQSPHPIELASLAPEFSTDRHQLYYDLLIQAVDGKKTHNVALTGAFGTGKSSILEKLHEERGDEVVELSLSTISPESVESTRTDSVAESRTNQIQKEIVKQLLYRLPPAKVPQSRFRRTSVPSLWRELRLAVPLGVLTTALLVGLGLVQPALEERFSEVWRQRAALGTLAVAISLGIWLILVLVRNRPVLAASLQTGPATVTLSGESGSYFDEYLDEIVYFFQVSKRRIVVIEDIDRFEDVLVFDTLRALNGLLNSSEQFKHKIVFVYAIRDSVFELIGRAEDNGADRQAAKKDFERASRTKFFDCIIPVVPFVSADNARDLMSEVMRSDDFTIDPALIRLAARHLADMRLLRNIRNEFEVYRNRLIVPEDSIPEISDDLVFAIVVFKNRHLSDFEQIRYRSSTLDELYELWRSLVRENLSRYTQKLADLRQRASMQQTGEARAAALGRRLAEVTGVLTSAAARGSANASARLNGVASDENLSESDIWRQIADGAFQDIVLTIPQRGWTFKLSFTAEDLEVLMRQRLKSDDWQRTDADALKKEIEEVEKKLEFLKHHSWGDLCKESEYVLSKPVALSSTASEEMQCFTFDDLVQQTLQSDLARELVRNGFLTSHFALHSAIYYGEHLGRDAMEYISRCIDPGVPDMTFELTEEDVIQILREQDAEVDDQADLFTDASVYNVSILDYLLSEREGAAKTVARRLARRTTADAEFLDCYLAQGKRAGRMTQLIAQRWSGILDYLAAEAPVDQPTRVELLDNALMAIPNDDFAIGPQLSQLLASSYRELRAIVQPNSVERASVAIGIVSKSGAVLESLTPLNEMARLAAVRRRVFVINTENLETLAGEKSISLDSLRQIEPSAYAYTVDRLGDYLTALGASNRSRLVVESPEAFTEILADVARVGRNHGLLQEFIALTDDECRVSTLTEVPKAAWEWLLLDRRTDPTFANVKTYFDEHGEIDASLGSFLSAERYIDEASAFPDEDRLAMAIDLLNASKEIPEPTVRIELAKSLQPGIIPIENIHSEPGDYVSLLLASGLVADEASVFTPRLMVDWPTYEATIASSQKYSELVSPELLAVSQIVPLLRSSVVSRTVKKSVVDKLAAYIDGASRREVNDVARALVLGGWRIRHGRIEALRSAGAEPTLLIHLIALEGDGLQLDAMKSLLRAMGDPYVKVADGGRGRPRFSDDEAHADVLNRLVGDTVSQVRRKSFREGTRLVAYLRRGSG